MILASISIYIGGLLCGFAICYNSKPLWAIGFLIYFLGLIMQYKNVNLI